jgi:hypothetical protein
MPWHQKAKKGAASGETPRVVASELKSVDTRMGQPGTCEQVSPTSEHIGSEEPDPVN